LLEEIGLEGRRVQMINVSAAMAGPFAFSAAELTAEIKQMGPNPLKGNNAKSMTTHPCGEREDEDNGKATLHSDRGR
jgi:hypothetical protein